MSLHNAESARKTWIRDRPARAMQRRPAPCA